MSTRIVYGPSNSCPVCGADKGAKCSATEANDGNGLFYRCRGARPSTEFECFKEGTNGFRYYRRADDLARGSQSRRDRRLLGIAPPPQPKPQPAKPVTDWAAVAAGYVRHLTGDLKYDLAERLGLPASVFGLLPQVGYQPDGVMLVDGWPVDKGTWTFPQTDGAGKVVGIEHRHRREALPPGANDKISAAGCNRGLIVPVGWDSRPGPILAVEGGSCLMACLAAGASAVARPGNNSGAEQLAELLRALPADREIIVVGENDEKANGDWPGRDGAMTVATKVAEQLKRPVEWALPPAGLKDSRDWLKDGGPWSHLTWAERGAKLLEHFAANAVTVGVKPEAVAVALPATTATAEPPAAVAPTLATGPVANEVAAAIRELLTPTCRCQHPRILIGKRPSSGRRGAVPFGCHKNACEVCGLTKRRDLFDASEAYVERLTNPATNAGVAMVVYMAVVPFAANVALKRAVERKGGKYLAIDTTDPTGIVRGLSAPEVSHLGHEIPDSSTCLKCDTATDDETDGETHTLWTVLLPEGKEPPRAAAFARVTEAATVLRAWGAALITTPNPPEVATRFRFWRASRAWGEKIEKPVGDFLPEGPSAYQQHEIRKMVEDLRVASEFWFADPKVQGRPVGWNACPASSLCLSLLLRGAESSHRYSIDRATDVARQWLDWIPDGTGDGRRVEQVLRENLWLGPPTDTITDDLRSADEQDRAEEAALAESSEIYASLRDSYRGRESELTGLLAELLA